MDYFQDILSFTDSELFDSLEDTNIEQEAYACYFNTYCDQYLTLQGLSYLYENFSYIVAFPTGDGVNVLQEKLFPLVGEISVSNIKQFTLQCVKFHILVAKVSTGLSFSNKFSASISSKDVSDLLKSLAKKIFFLEFEPTYYQIQRAYDVFRTHGYSGRILWTNT